MIVPMKKASVIVMAKDAAAALEELRRLGVLHVEHQEPPKDRDLSVLEEDKALLDNCLGVFDSAGIKYQPNAGQTEIPADWRSYATHVVEMWKRYDRLESFSNATLRTIAEWEKWGDFDPDKISKLSAKGVNVRLYEVPLKRVDDFPSDVIVKTIYTKGHLAGCAVISTRDFDCPFNEIMPPAQGLAAMRARVLEDAKIKQSITGQINRLGRQCGGLLRARGHLEKEIEFQKALSGMGQAAKVSYITGYLPADAAGKLMEASRSNNWGVLINDPKEDDNVPTLVRNPRWVSVISPVFKLLEVIPGYRELDISLPFLIFFSIFFGMLIGDAGYGTVYFLLTYLAQKKWGRRVSNRSVFYLFYILSACAIAWGILIGSFFGQGWLQGTSYRPLVPALNDVKNIQTFCFFLGALHLSLAHSWKAILKLPSISALADLGWIFILWSAFMAANTLILGDPFPYFGRWTIILGVTFVVLFTSPRKNVLKGIGAGLGTLALSLMNNFTDVVSYVRLFAVGLAGVAIADAFNSMASSVGKGNAFAVLLSGLVLLAGHGLNLVLGPMSVLVHGVRLNVLEFCSHADVSWSGFSYKPFEE